MDTQAVKLDGAIEFSLRGSFGGKAATMAAQSLKTASQPFSLNNVLKQTTAMILAGGQGERLFPLTRDRAKPAVPFGGIYRIIDFTLSNCLNSGIRKMHVLTQYKSHSLARHIKQAWNLFPSEMDECIDVLPPQLAARTSAGRSCARGRPYLQDGLRGNDRGAPGERG